MAHILVRNVRPQVLKRLKSRAAARGGSLQSEVASILEQAAGEPRLDRRAAVELLARFRRRLKGRKLSDSARLIRQDRDR